MCEKIKAFWSDLDVMVRVNKQELVLGAAVCTLAGVVAGMLCSPRKNVTVGSHNSQVIDNRGSEEEEDEEARDPQ